MSRCVLLNVAHAERCPRRLEGAAVRILGFFPDENALRAHAQAHYGENELDLVAVPAQQWAAILRRAQGGDELAHLRSLSESYRAREKRHEEEFRENVTQQRAGAVHSPAPQPDKQMHAGSLQEPPGVPRAAELRLQRFAVLSLLPDVEEQDPRQQQPALIFWEAFDNEEDAREHIKKHLSVRARDVHLDIVAMYEWLPLTNLDLCAIREEFRDESLTDIMQKRKDEKTQVDEYRTLCEQRGQEPALLDLSVPSNGLVVPPPLDQQAPLPNLEDPSK
jgi:hypothetical protein